MYCLNVNKAFVFFNPVPRLDRKNFLCEWLGLSYSEGVTGSKEEVRIRHYFCNYDSLASNQFELRCTTFTGYEVEVIKPICVVQWRAFRLDSGTCHKLQLVKSKWKTMANTIVFFSSFSFERDLICVRNLRQIKYFSCLWFTIGYPK